MANDVDLDKVVLEAVYQPTSPPFDVAGLDKVVVSAAYKPTSPPFDVSGLDKAVLGAAYQRASVTPGDEYFGAVRLLIGAGGADASTSFTDDSWYVHTLNVTGNAQVDTAQSKFGGSSLLLDGTGDSLTSPNSGDWNLIAQKFTIEAWVRFNVVGDCVFLSHYHSSLSDREWAWSYSNTSGCLNFIYSLTGGTGFNMLGTAWTPSTGVWYHIAVERWYNTFRHFVDGVEKGRSTMAITLTSSPTPLLRIGNYFSGSELAYFNGWMDEIRLTKGVARYTIPANITNADASWANVVLLCGADGHDALVTLADESDYVRTLTTVGNAQIDTAQSKFGGSSALFDGAGDYFTAVDSADWDLTGSFTIEAFIRTTTIAAGARTIVAHWQASNLSWSFYTGAGTLALNVSTTGANTFTDLVSATPIAINTWYHVCADFDGTKYRLYIDGTMVGSSTTLRTMFSSSAVLSIGADASGSSAWNGWIDELRITKGVARYASDAGFTAPTVAYPRPVVGFTPPTAAFPRGMPAEPVNDIATVTGVSATGSVGQVTVVTASATNVTASPSGLEATGSVGQVAVNAISNIVATPSGVQGVASVGQVTVDTAAGVTVTVTGLQAIGAVGDVSVVVDTGVIAAVTGVQATGYVGQVTVGDVIVSVTGVQATGRVGQVTVVVPVSVTATVHGVQAFGRVGDVTVEAINTIVLLVPVERTVFADAEDRSVDAAQETRGTIAPKDVRAVDNAADLRVVFASAEHRIVMADAENRTINVDVEDRVQ